MTLELGEMFQLDVLISLELGGNLDLVLIFLEPLWELVLKVDF
jgi:hypothetical protein